VSSLRAYGLEENVLDDMQRVRATGITFAPEAGSQRMRDVVNKNVTEEQLMETAERVFSRGWSSMKLYFMIGLPTEEESDVREIVKVGARARQVGKEVKKSLREKGLPGGGGAPKVVVSVSTHVPKPHTPFQWCRVDSPDEIRAKQAWLEEEKRASGGVDLRMHDCDTSWLEAVFARGDRRLADVLERAYADGARFDSWEDRLRIELWKDAFRATGVLPSTYLGTIPVTARLPWDHIDVGLEEGFLAREYRKALANRLSLPCGKAAGMFVHHTNLAEAKSDEKNLVCYDCGIACDLGAMRHERLVYLRKLGADDKRPPPPSPLDAPARLGTGPKRPPVAFVQGQARRYRFAYTKLGASALLSHLDLIRALPRAFRRLELPLFYSTGFHPKPEMTFGPALSLGVASLMEFVDVKLTTDLVPDAWLRPLSDASPEGMRFVAAARLGESDASVSRVIDSARYAVALPASALREHGGASWLAERVALALGARDFRLLRTIEGIGRWIDVRAFVRGISLETPGARAAVEAAGLVGDFSVLEVDLEIRGSGAVKISEVVTMLTGLSDFSHRAVRFALGMWSPSLPDDTEGSSIRVGGVVSPMDLRAVRHRPPRQVDVSDRTVDPL
jgi:radical SAM-linked protein